MPEGDADGRKVAPVADLRSDFVRIVRAWYERPDRFTPLSLNQVASYTFGLGNADGTRLVGKVLNQYSRYFSRSGRDHSSKWRPEWMRIREDFPELLEPTESQPRLPNGARALEERFLRALNDEIVAIRAELERRPIEITDAARRQELEIPGSRVFQFTFLAPSADGGQLPIPDGCPVRLVWRGLSANQGTLLSQDPSAQQVLVAVDASLDLTLRKGVGRLEPAYEEVVRAFIDRGLRALGDPNGLARKVADPKLQPAQVARRISTSPTQVDESQARALEEMSRRDITFLWGPPGTGKTHTLGEFIATQIASGRRVLAAATANIAVDQIALHTLRAARRGGLREAGVRGAMLRYGSARDPKVLSEPLFFPDPTRAQELRAQIADLREKLRSEGLAADERAIHQQSLEVAQKQLKDLMKLLFGAASVVFATAAQVVLQPAFEEVPFDVLVLDESSMLPIAHAIALARFAREQIVIAGDFRQLGPIALSVSEAAEEWLLQSPFEYHAVERSETVAHPALVMLRAQRRMHPEISACVNEIFYRGELEDRADPDRTQAAKLPPLRGSGRVFVEVEPPGVSQVQMTPGGSRQNKASAMVVATLAARLVARHQVETAIITPYRAQVALIRDLLREFELPSSTRKRLHIGTIHTFQGSERSVVLFDLVEDRFTKIGRLFQRSSGDRLVNVAVTRAQGKLIVVGNFQTFFWAPGRELMGRAKRVFLDSFPSEFRLKAAEAIKELMA